MQLRDSRYVRALLLVSVGMPVLVACSGSSSPSQQTVSDPTQAAANARAACDAVITLPKASGTSPAAQLQATKDADTAFNKAADLSLTASREDSRWTVLANAAANEAAAFDVILKASTTGVTNEAEVNRAAALTRQVRPAFIAQCQKAESTTASPGASPTA